MLLKTPLKTFATVAVTSTAVLCAATLDNAYAASFNSISRIYAFGDSYSDNGASLSISTKAVEAGVKGASILPPFLQVYDPDGRWTNTGLTSVEVLAKRENLKLTNYAVGGGKSGNGNLNSWLDAYQDTGLFGQIEQYKTEVNSSADPQALHFIFISTNDLLEKVFFNQPFSANELASQAVNNIAQGVKKLSDVGAKQFFVVNSSDVTALPFFQNNLESATKFRDTVNQLLPNQLNALQSQLGVQVALYDHVAISNKIRESPAQYGFSNLNNACQPLYSSSGFQPGCSSPDSYYFWDEIHPTRRVHQVIGEDMASYLSTQKSTTVPEPSTILALLAGAGVVGFTRKKALLR